MSDSLRDRVAATLTEAAAARGLHGLHRADVEFMADVLIRELGLDKEFGCPVAGHHYCRCSHRYTTEWKDNE